MKKSILAVIILTCLGLSASASSNHNSISFITDTLKKGKNYILFSKTENITNVSFSQNKKKENLISIRFGYPNPMAPTNTIGGAIQTSNSNYGTKKAVPVFDKIEILGGKYEDIKVEKENDLRNRFILSGLQFPLKLKLISGKEVIELELQEAGFWNLAIELKNN